MPTLTIDKVWLFDLLMNESLSVAIEVLNIRVSMLIKDVKYY